MSRPDPQPRMVTVAADAGRLVDSVADLAYLDTALVWRKHDLCLSSGGPNMFSVCSFRRGTPG
jgi:hypothetical protein